MSNISRSRIVDCIEIIAALLCGDNDLSFCRTALFLTFRLVPRHGLVLSFFLPSEVLLVGKKIQKKEKRKEKKCRWYPTSTYLVSQDT